MNENSPRFFALAVCLTTALTGFAARADSPTLAVGPSNLLYVESNNPASGENSVIGYQRRLDGTLTLLPGSPFLTGGAGVYNLAGGPIFDADDIMAYSPASNTLYVPNGGSNTVAAFHIGPRGRLHALAKSPFVTQGQTPNALGLVGNTLVVVSNAGAVPGGVSSYNSGGIRASGAYSEQTSAQVTLGAVNPTEAVAVPGTRYVITVEMAGGTISSRYIDSEHRLHLVQSVMAPIEGTVQPVQLGLAVHPTQPYVYVGLPNVGQLATYGIDGTGHLTFIGTSANSGKAICWVQVAPDGRHAYSTNPGDGSVSAYDLSNPASPVEVAHVPVNPAGALFQFKVSPDNQFLYALESESNAANVGLSNKIHILSLAPTTGIPTELPGSPVALPLAGGTRAQGVQVF